jgi:integrase
VICVTTRGTRWTGDGFSASFRKTCEAAGIEGLTFHDLRGTAVTRLAIAGCTDPEIATITGHSMKTVQEMLDRHYLSRDIAMAESAIAKLEKHQGGTGFVNRPVNRSGDQG